MSKLNSDLLKASIAQMLAFSGGEDQEIKGETIKGKKRNFTETIELQVTLKNYDPQRDKRFSGTFKLPNAPQKPTVYGDDLPPGLPDVFGLNKSLRKAVTGGSGGDVQGRGGIGDAAPSGSLFDADRFRSK